MKLDEIVAWYQKKIGTYDKQQWEKTVEQKILDGFSNGVILKTAKLKTELIDVDLVRGSTFPKAKPKQSLLTVIRLAILRYLLLPIYAQWWVKQTSPNIFAILLTLYITQMINWAIYTFNINRLEQPNALDITITNRDQQTGNFCCTENGVGDELQTTTTTTTYEHSVSLSDLIIPMVLSLILCFIHSQIVATITLTESGKKRRCQKNNAKPHSKHHRDQRLRRRKKLRMRNSENTSDIPSGSITPRRYSNPMKLINLGLEKLGRPVITVPYNSNTELYLDNKNNLKNQSGLTTAATSATPSSSSQPLKLTKIDLIGATTTESVIGVTEADTTELLQHKKRNVNWQNPIDNLSNDLMEQLASIDTDVIDKPISITKLANTLTSSSSSSSTGSGCSTNSARQHIDNYVREFYDDLLTRSEMLQTSSPLSSTVDFESDNRSDQGTSANNAEMRRKIGEDDGFESLNGKSSSGEENITIILAPPSLTNDADIASTSASAALSTKKQLRLRLNVNENLKQNIEIAANTVAKTPMTFSRRQVTDLTDTSDSSGQQQRPTTSPTSDTYQKAKKLNLGESTKNVDNNSSADTDEEDDDVETSANPVNNSNCNECTTSATEWLGITTNSDECSNSSDMEHTEEWKGHPVSDEDSFEVDFTPATILNSHGTNDRISCTVWNHHEIEKAQMSVLEISSCIIERVESMPESNDYIYFGIFFSVLLSLVPIFCRLCEASIVGDKLNEFNYFDAITLLWEKASFSVDSMIIFLFGQSRWEQTILIISFMQRLFLTGFLFIIFAVAERTFKHRFLYAKLFSHITSSRRARKSNLPHFRLNKVRNIKTWLSVRSYLKKRGPQRSVDVIVSAAFIVTLLLLAFLSVEWLKDSGQLHSQFNLEALIWAATIGIFLLRFMTLGNKIHQKYRSVSVLITEQINLYLQIEQKPKKKDELMVSNSVLKLAADLLKELETPFKISGLSANPYLFTTIKVVILSALSGVLSEMLGFKLKLHKIKIK